MEIGSYHVYDNTTDYKDYWASAASPLPKNATNVEGCGCYIIKKKMKVIGYGKHTLHITLTIIFAKIT